MPDAPLPAHAVGPDCARWVQRLAELSRRVGNLEDYSLIMALRTRLQLRGAFAEITLEERARAERIEKGIDDVGR